MASELTVQTIKAPTSGGNANKILIGSGQTLIQTGSVIQTIHLGSTNVQRKATTSSSFVATYLYNTITPKFANSKIIVRAATTGNNNTNNGTNLVYTYYRTISGGSATILREGEASGNYWGIGQVYAADARVQAPLIAEIVDAPNTTTETEYRIYIRSHGGGSVELPATTTEHCEMIIQEIAQ